MEASGHIGRYLARGIDALRREDPVVYEILEREHVRESECLTLVASCGGTDASVLAVSAASIINVTAEGYPGKRYHAGCRYVDEAEQLAIERTKAVFGARFVNVQPHCASFANHIIMHMLLQPGDTILGMALDQGGHLTHGAPVNLSGKLFDVHGYGLDADGLIDYAQLRELAHEHRPKLIICGTTSYTRIIDFERIREVADEVGAYVLADITHIAGLVATGLHPSPIDVCHFTTTCTFKQLYGPRGGLIMMGRDADTIAQTSNRALSELVQSAVFPMMQGSPAVQVIAAKARAMGRLLEPEFHDLTARIRSNADALAENLVRRGYRVIGGGTDNHMVLFEVPDHLNGVVAERALESCGILVNKNKLPGDRRSAAVASGVRLGSNTAAVRAMGPPQMALAVELIDTVLSHTRAGAHNSFEIPAEIERQVEGSVRELCRQFPLPYDLAH